MGFVESGKTGIVEYQKSGLTKGRRPARKTAKSKILVYMPVKDKKCLI